MRVRNWILASGLILGLLWLGGCASTRTIKIFVPSSIVLKEYGTIGIIDFDSNADYTINKYATQLFREYVQKAQPGVPFLELGTQREVLANIGATQLNAQTIQKIGEVYHVDAVFIGDLIFSAVKTDFDISQALHLKASMKTSMDATLTVRLELVRNGATVWSRSSSYARTLSRLGIQKGSVSYSDNSADAQRKLLPDMIDEVVCDFRGRYVKQRVPK